MKKKRRGIVEWQKVKEIRGTDYSHYASEDVEEPENETTETYQARPELLPEQDTSPSSPQLLMGEAIEHLQGRQREAYILSMREDKSLAEVGELLGISKSSAQVYLDRAIAFITAYCKAAMAKERI